VLFPLYHLIHIEEFSRVKFALYVAVQPDAAHVV